MDPRMGSPDGLGPPTQELTAFRFERSYEDDVAMALSALDCVLLSRKGVYASSELTSGRRAQRLQREHNIPDPAALRDRLGERYESLVWSPNVEAALAFAEDLRSRIVPGELVISPAPFLAPAWTQSAYLTFWSRVIRSRVQAVYLNDGWQFSNGCVHEFTVAHDERLPTFGRDGKPIPEREAIQMIREAIKELESAGLDSRSIRKGLKSLTQAASE